MGGSEFVFWPISSSALSPGGPLARRTGLWGGPECTVSRHGGRWRDQPAETGLRDRPGDIDLIAGLGLRTVRYPVLWEAVCSRNPARPDFAWADERLGRLREAGIEVIAGLLHHGSGPGFTSLLDPDFPAKLADFAATVAERSEPRPADRASG